MAIRRFSGGMSARPVRAACRARGAAAARCREPQLADVELLVSELATNSVRHAGCDDADEISVEADVTA